MSDIVEQQGDDTPEIDIYSKDLSQREYEDLRQGKKIEATSEKRSEKGEPKHKSVSEMDEIDEESDTSIDEDDSEGYEDESDESEDTDEQPKKSKRKSGFKKRIDKLNQRVSERDQRIEELQRQLEQRLNQSNDEPQKYVAQKDNEDGKPQFPAEDEFETYEEFKKAEAKYLDDLTDWKVEQRFKKEAEQKKISAKQSEYQKVVQNHAERVQEFKKHATDFDEVVQDGLAGFQPNAAFEAAILDSDVSAQLIYQLAKDPEELDRINSLSPMRLAREIGRIEARISSKSSSKNENTFRTTSAPKPTGKVGTRGKGHARSLYEADKLSQSEWERMREKQIRERRSR